VRFLASKGKFYTLPLTPQRFDVVHALARVETQREQVRVSALALNKFNLNYLAAIDSSVDHVDTQIARPTPPWSESAYVESWRKVRVCYVALFDTKC
jgi:hypothetical protein